MAGNLLAEWSVAEFCSRDGRSAERLGDRDRARGYVACRALVRIAPGHPWPDKPRWAPDGRTLYFLSRHSRSYFNLWGLRFEPERGTPLASLSRSRLRLAQARISPDLTLSEMDVSARQRC